MGWGGGGVLRSRAAAVATRAGGKASIRPTRSGYDGVRNGVGGGVEIDATGG